MWSQMTKECVASDRGCLLPKAYHDDDTWISLVHVTAMCIAVTIG